MLLFSAIVLVLSLGTKVKDIVHPWAAAAKKTDLGPLPESCVKGWFGCSTLHDSETRSFQTNFFYFLCRK
ncbi:hypothetical protein EFB08_05220 [Rufibacter latericius]|uniref:Uncharacterized protein n=1 Tax=Rufibacter latericius TaxID=2487040 RepID=A0A3M9N0J0_9BACT|nr:hypothetical protein EFB08_05220 [Rufibacter latericius]